MLKGGRAVAVGMASFLETFSVGRISLRVSSGRRSLDEIGKAEKAEFFRTMKIRRLGVGR